MTRRLLLLGLVALVTHVGAVDIIRAAKALASTSTEDLRSGTIENLFYTISVADLLGKRLALDDQEICKRLAQDFAPSTHLSLDECFFIAGVHQLLTNRCELSWIEKHIRQLDAPSLASPRELFRYLYATESLPDVRKVPVKEMKEYLKKLTSQKLSDSELGYCLLAGAMILPDLKSEIAFFQSLLKLGLTRLKLLSSRLYIVESDQDVSELIIGIMELNEVLSSTSTSSLDKESVLAITNFVEQAREPAAELTWRLVDIADRLCPPQIFAIYDKALLRIAPVDESRSSSVYVDVRNPIMYLSVSDLLGRPVDATLKLVGLKSIREGQDFISLDKQFDPKDSTRMVHSVSLQDSNIPAGCYLADIRVTFYGEQASSQEESVPVDFKTSAEVAFVTFKTSDSAGNFEVLMLKQGDRLAADTTLSRDKDVRITVNLEAAKQEGTLPEFENAFVCFEPDQGEEAIAEVLKHYQTCFGPSQKSPVQYQFEITGAALGARIMGMGGTYTVRFVAHHRLLLHSVEYNLGHVNCNYKKRQDTLFASLMQPKRALISHTFKKPEPRPPFLVSAAFSAIIVAPLILLLISWKSVGANLSKCPLSICVPLYHLVHGASIAALCYCWAFKDMFFTIKTVVLLHVALFLFGRRVAINALKKQ